MNNCFTQWLHRMKYDLGYACEELRYWNWKPYDGVGHHLSDFWCELTLPLRMTKYAIENFITYFKIIWFDRDWDHYFLEELIRFKLDRMIKHISEHANHEDWEETVKSMQFVYNCFERLRKDEYRTKIEKKLVDEYGELDMCSIPHIIDEHDRPKTYEAKFSYSKCDTAEKYEQASEKFRELHFMQDRDAQRDRKRAYTTMAKYIIRWWD